MLVFGFRSEADITVALGLPSLVPESSTSGTAHNGLGKLAQRTPHCTQSTYYRVAPLPWDEHTRPVRNYHGPTIFRKTVVETSLLVR